ncbi:hypothetical protein IGS68_19080 [Skermanella sp. TT6]|uniref:NrS-1 polymerase-like helicase domain-containing protein n=1 Tax=Skermanella cutis TaxID=2775420 RepID=A0ABX7B1I5_9PROT|nr:primase-helicase family protein [Skermanella sp. TT6]QQP88148.1 hypothetical protein IGS68_19080 [Skermanella sp. TT6]
MTISAFPYDHGGAPNLGAVEFALYWSKGNPFTLIAIYPSGKLIGRTLNPDEIEAGVPKFVKFHQENQANIYFVPNQTHGPVSTKPAKSHMAAALAVCVDIDPREAEELKPGGWDRERQRILAQADELAADPDCPPTVIIDSGNGVQLFWRFAEPCPLDGPNGEATRRNEALAKAIGKALGGDNTFNTDRIMRMPGTLNFPHGKKKDKGRGITQARVLWLGGGEYSPDQLEALPDRLFAEWGPSAFSEEATDLPANRPRSPMTTPEMGAAIAALISEMRAKRVLEVREWADLSPALQSGLDAALATSEPLRCRWEGDTAGLMDTSRSGLDMSLASMLKQAGFSGVDVALILRAFEHGAACETGKHTTEAAQLRYLARCVVRSFDRADTPAWVLKMNERHAVVFDAGKTLVMTEKLDYATGKPVYVFSSPAQISSLYANHRVEVGRRKNGQPMRRPLGDAWLEHEHRRQFLGGLVFLPGQVAPADTFNLWRGFGIEPRPGEWPLLRRHLLDVICLGSTSLCDWLLNWCAHMFQQPMVKAEVAVVLRGGEGNGKGTLGRALRDILGIHGIQVTNPRHVVGNFNGHLRDVLLLFADEAFFAGDRAADGVLKGLITEPTLMIERKGVDAVQAPNLLRVIMATNNDWAVPAAKDARRYLVLDVPDTVKGKSEYFTALNAEMEAGGLAAFLHDMLRRDIARWNHRTAPTTAGLIEQKLFSLHGVSRWWFERLCVADCIFRLNPPSDFGGKRPPVSVQTALPFRRFRPHVGVEMGGV